MSNGSAGRIVVGVDGSDGAAVALAWALDEARLRGAVVDAVWAWQMPWLSSLSEVGAALDDSSWFERAAREGLDRAVDAAVDGGPGAEGGGAPAVERLVVQGDAARALLDVARGADMLVVGSRGRGGFSGLMLGSVSQQCATHARCPVVVVHGDDR